MTGFSADWLALRTPADDRARARDLVAHAASRLTAAVDIVDLGAGTGATLRALAGLLPTPQRWCLVDADATLLAEAERRAPEVAGPDIAVTFRMADLLADPGPWAEPPSLVTASALFDLTSAEWIERFAVAAAAARAPVLAMLSYDGYLVASPEHPHDAAMREAFNRHQRGNKSFGPASGPEAPANLTAAFAAQGYAVEEVSTPWLLERERDGDLIAATLKGWAGAARELDPVGAPAIDAWLADRLADTRRLEVGHRDQLFWPA